MATFHDLNLSKPLLRALDELGFSNPTPIQEKAFPVIMSGKDAVGIAQTGTGKTFAYLLPILRQHTFSEQRHPRVLIVVPTRELVAQVVDEISRLSQYMSLRVYGVYGASNINTQKQKVYDGLDILVGTPGRLIDLTLSRSLQFSAIKKLVIDEVDEMLNLGFRPQLKQILEVLPPKRQNLMFSATLTEDVEAMIESYFNEPEYVELISRGTPLEKIIQEAYHVPNFYTKVNLLKWLLAHDKGMSRVLLFVKNKKIADDLEAQLSEEFGAVTGVIHSNRTQPQRFNAVKQFQEGTHRLLIATDVVARGLDFQGVTHVVNFDMPKDASSYIHRIGRTGRADTHGAALSFVIPKELKAQKAAEELMNHRINVLDLPEDVEISEELTFDEMPVTRDKNLKKQKFEMPTGAFHEKKAKNKKLQLGGKRRQEGQRRALEKSRSKRGGR